MNKLQRQGIIPWLLLGIMGVLCIIFSRTMTQVVEIILGIGLILAGLGGVIGWWQQGRSRNRNDLITLLLAAAGIALGIWILTHLDSFDRILNIIIGVSLILAGVQYVVANWKTMGLKMETIMAALAVVLGVVILGVVILIRFNATTMPFVLAGIGMIYAAVCGVVNELRR